MSDTSIKHIDIHAHVNFAAFSEDRDAVIARTLKGGTAIINVGSQYETSKLAVELAERYESGVYAIVGTHPIHSKPAPEPTLPPTRLSGAER